METSMFPQTSGPYSGTSTPRFDLPYDQAFGTPRGEGLFDIKTDYFAPKPSSSGLTPYGFTPGMFGNSPYPNPMDITPPQSATDVPSGWPYSEHLPDQTDDLSSHVPQINSSTAKIQYGQTTPPDEAVRAPDLDDLENSFPRPKTGTKRDSSSSTKSTKPTKRSKKSKAVEETNEEVEKRSKFLERNRVAASKCRQKKKEHNSQLEHRAKDLEKFNAQLKVTMQELLTEKTSLMMQMAMHTPDECDCHQIHQHLASFKALYQQPPATETPTRSGSVASIASPSAVESIEQ